MEVWDICTSFNNKDPCSILILPGYSLSTVPSAVLGTCYRLNVTPSPIYVEKKIPKIFGGRPLGGDGVMRVKPS